MAVDLSGTALPSASRSVPLKAALAGAASVTTAVTLPSWASSVDITLLTGDDPDTDTGVAGSYAVSGTDGAAQGDAFPIPAGSAINIPLRSRVANVLYLSSGTVSAYAFLNVIR